MKFFQPVSAAKVASQLLTEAQRMAVEHEAAAEHHKALADMFKARVARLSKQAEGAGDA